MNIDGKVTYYALQAKYVRISENEYDNRWFFHVDADGYPGHTLNKDYVSIKNGNNDPSACGVIWQTYGYHGVTNLNAAIEWLKHILVYHDRRMKKDIKKDIRAERLRCIWRIVKIIKTQKIEPVITTENLGWENEKLS